ncbi:MAG: hypothetical protein KatS3mg131_0582 [Candidatus Tectimicrobiota bacterium]|nr:MAG: hypothetical protein KatS3mg131_0582 [Candidatus Tectomicrobia bacterium]
MASLLVQSGTNLVDEYADHRQGGSAGKVLAPYKVIALGLLTPRAVWHGALVCFGVATLIGVYLVLRTGWPLALVCLASVGVAYAYSAGPLPLGHLALGEPLVFVFMGPVMVGGSFYVQIHTLHQDALWLSLPVACLVTAILVANNLRDAEEDRRSGKQTLVTLWGRRPAACLYGGLLLVAFASPVALVAGGHGRPAWLLPLLTLPLAWRVARLAWQGGERPLLHRALRQTAKLHLWFGLLLAAGGPAPCLPGRAKGG